VPDLVPTIDLAGWDAGGGARASIAAAVDDACRRVGFLQLIGHAVPSARIQAMQAAADELFALPLDQRLALTAPPEVNRGYAPLGSESLSYSLGVDSPPDLFEAFNVGPEDVPDDAVHTAQRHGVFAPNVWPDDRPDVRRDIVTYFDEVAALARRVSSVFAVALGLDEHHFRTSTDHSTDTLRLINYVRPENGRGPEPGQLRMGAHTDYGILTILYADPVPGLEIIGPDGSWHPVVPADGAFLVNLGDLLAQWTNDRWRSTVHRVVPPDGPGPARRRSAAFFHDGNYDAVVECLPTCLAPGEQPRYPPVVAGEHLQAKVLSGRSRAKADPDLARDTLGERRAAVTGPAGD
jgi:isopenicillin N synthase-like dioxygenase